MKLVWTRLALEDLNNAYEYIAAENPRAAATMVERIEAAVRALRAHPNLGRAGRVEGTRELVIAGTPFIVPYQVGKKQVKVLAMIHAARRWPSGF